MVLQDLYGLSSSNLQTFVDPYHLLGTEGTEKDVLPSSVRPHGVAHKLCTVLSVTEANAKIGEEGWLGLGISSWSREVLRKRGYLIEGWFRFGLS